MRLFPALPAALGAAIVLASPAHAATPVIIEGADKEIADAIRALLPDRNAPESLFDSERIAEEAAARALAWLRSEGYYAAHVTAEAREEPPLARIVVSAGERFRFAAPIISYDTPPAPEASAAALQALNGLHEGAPARAASVLQAEANALEAVHQAGYADATPGERRVVVDHATQTVAAEFRIMTGARARLGEVRAEPAEVFRPGFIADLRNWDTGAAYTPEALARLRRDLSATGAVSRVATRLDPPDPSGVRNVTLEVEPAKRNSYELGLGYSTTEGVGLEAEWTRRNLSGRADALSIGTTLGELRQELTASLIRPHSVGLGRALTFGAGLRREDSDAFERVGASVSASVEATRRRLELAQSYGVALSADRFNDVVIGETDAYVVTGFYNLRRDTTGFSLDPRDGDMLELRLEPAVSAGDSSVGFARMIGEARTYESFGANDRATLAARARVGWLEALSGSVDDVPPDRRFYAGGGGSVRGYEYNTIYPRERDTLGLTPGGQGLLEGSLEARWRFNDRWGAAAFADAGAAFDDWRDAGDLSAGAGIGLRYDLGFAPLRIDVAFPLDEDERRSDYALYISLGQAF